MNDNDLRDCFAMFALAGSVMANKERTAEDVWQIADDMMEARNKKEIRHEEDNGIAAVVPKRSRKR